MLFSLVKMSVDILALSSDEETEFGSRKSVSARQSFGEHDKAER